MVYILVNSIHTTSLATDCLVTACSCKLSTVGSVCLVDGSSNTDTPRPSFLLSGRGIYIYRVFSIQVIYPDSYTLCFYLYTYVWIITNECSTLMKASMSPTAGM